jgi:septum formation protein
MICATPLILASESPRRRELLAYLGIPFTVRPSRFEELPPEPDTDPAWYAREQALGKALEVSQRHPNAAILGADTVVALDNRILGKPADAREAWQMLQELRGQTHSVITGIALVTGNNEWVNHANTLVTMRDYSDDEIAAYIARGEPFDKAGGYAIQDRRFRPVLSCEGCYCNVVGLPLVPTQQTLEQVSLNVLNFRPPDLPPECYSCPLLNKANKRNPLAPY